MSGSKIKLLIIVSFVIPAVIGVVVLIGNHASVSSSDKNRNLMKELMAQAKNNAIRGEQDSAMFVYSHMADLYGEEWLDREDKRLALNAMGRLGYIYLDRFSDYHKSYELIMRALTESERLNFKENMAYDYIAMAILYRYEDIHNKDDRHADSVFHLLKKAFYTSLEIKDFRRASYAIANMATFASGSGNLQRVSKELKTFQSMDLPDSLSVPIKALCKGLICLDTRKYDNAIAYFHTLRNHHYGDIELYYSNMADVYKTSGDLRKAVIYMDSLKSLNIEQQDLQGQMQACDILYKYHSLAGNEKEAIDNRIEYFETREKIHSLNNIANIKYIRMTRQLERTKAALDKATISNTYQSRLLTASAIAFVSLLFLIAVMIIFYVRLKRNNKDIFLRNQQLIANEEWVAKEHSDLIRQIQQLKECEGTNPGQETTTLSDTQNNKYVGSTLSENDKDGIFTKIRQVMQETALICRTDFSLNILAQAVGEKPRHVSQVINEKAGMNFHSLLNEYRMKEACRRISDVQNYGHLSIEGIGESVGIKSRSQFAKVFKRFIGISPSEYSRLAKEQSSH